VITFDQVHLLIVSGLAVVLDPFKMETKNRNFRKLKTTLNKNCEFLAVFCGFQ